LKKTTAEKKGESGRRRLNHGKEKRRSNFASKGNGGTLSCVLARVFAGASGAKIKEGLGAKKSVGRRFVFAKSKCKFLILGRNPRIGGDTNRRGTRVFTESYSGRRQTVRKVHLEKRQTSFCPKGGKR